ncbi:MAG: alpha-E domain-containing protein [Polyangiales bacterium]
MLSRVADAVMWMNRYVERAENVARFVDVNLYLELDLPQDERTAWAPIVATTGDHSLFRERYGEATRDAVLRFLVLDREYPSSVVSCLSAARENARSVREVISSEMFEVVNQAYLAVRGADPAEALAAPHDFLTTVKQASQLFVGTTHLTMTHNEAWHFGRMGRLLERADKTSRIVDVKCFLLTQRPAAPGSPEDELQWLALLRSASAFEMYRKRHRRVTLPDVVRFLVLDEAFPRSVYHCVYEAERSLRAFTAAQGRDDGALDGPLTALTALRDELGRTTVDAVLDRGLHESLDAVQTKLNAVGTAVYETFLAR